MREEHPSAEELRSVLLGNLPDEDLSDVNAHLAKCAECAQLLDELSRSELDSFLSETLQRQDIDFNSIFPAGEATGYRVLDVIGSGGAGIVFVADDLTLNRKVAVKVLRPELATLQSHRDRFLNEARVLSRQTHPNLVRVHFVGTTSDAELPYFVMDFVEGRTLAEYGPLDGSLSVREIAWICSTVADALVGTNVVHRDIKPQNIMVSRTTRGLDVRLMDFGIAMDQETMNRITLTGVSPGTVAYMSPEQIRSPKNVSQQSDVFSLGIVLFEALTGIHPFHSKGQQHFLSRIADENQEVVDPRTFNSDIPLDLSRVTQKSLQKRLCDRYESMEQFRDDLRDFYNGNPVSVSLPGFWPKSVRFSRRNPVKVVASIATVLVACLVFLIQVQKGRIAEQGRVLAEYRVARAEAEADASVAKAGTSLLHASDASANHSHQLAAVAFADALRQYDSSDIRIALMDSLNFALHPVKVKQFARHVPDRVPPYSLLKASVSFCSTTNELLVSGGSDASHPYLRLYDVGSLELVRDYEVSVEDGRSRWFVHAKLSPDGNRFLALDTEGRLSIHMTETGESVCKAPDRYDRPRPQGPLPALPDSFCYSMIVPHWRTNDSFGVFKQGQELELWSSTASEMQLQRTLPMPEAMTITFLDEQKLLVMWSDRVEEHDLLQSSRREVAFARNDDQFGGAFEVNASRTRLVCGHGHGGLTCWSLGDNQGRQLWSIRIPEFPVQPQTPELYLDNLTRDERDAVEGMRVAFRDVTTGLSFVHDDFLTLMRGDGTFSVLNINNGQIENRAIGHLPDCWGMHWNECITGRGGEIVTIGQDGTIRQWRRGVTHPEQTLVEKVPHALTHCAYSAARNEWAATGQGHVFRWQRGSGRLLQSLNEGTPLIGISYLRDGQQLAYATSRELIVRDVEEDQELMRLPAINPNDQVQYTSMAVDIAGVRLAIGTTKGSVRLLELDGHLVGEFDVRANHQANPASIASITFRPDGKEISVADDTGRVTVWSADTLQKVLEDPLTGPVTTHSNGIAYGYTSRGWELVQAGKYADPVIWNKSRKHAVLQGHDRIGERVSMSITPAACYSIDGKSLVTGGADGAVFVWDTDSYSRIYSFFPSDLKSPEVSDAVAKFASAVADNRLRNSISDIVFADDGRTCFVINYSGKPFELNLTSVLDNVTQSPSDLYDSVTQQMSVEISDGVINGNTAVSAGVFRIRSLAVP